MGRRKGEDTPAKKRRRMPHVAVIEREEPFLRSDSEALEAECQRVTNGREYFRCQRRDGDRYVHVVHFSEEHQAKALQDWINRQRFAERPVPKFGPSPEERAAFEQTALLWGLRTGAVRRTVQAWRRKSREGGSLLQCQSAAQRTLRLFMPPDDRHFDMAQVFVSWAQREHGPWFYGYRSAIEALPHWFAPEDAYTHSED